LYFKSYHCPTALECLLITGGTLQERSINEAFHSRRESISFSSIQIVPHRNFVAPLQQVHTRNSLTSAIQLLLPPHLVFRINTSSIQLNLSTAKAATHSKMQLTTVFFTLTTLLAVAVAVPTHVKRIAVPSDPSNLANCEPGGGADDCHLEEAVSAIFPLLNQAFVTHWLPNTFSAPVFASTTEHHNRAITFGFSTTSLTFLKVPK
jgi:hypothetical protein